ncbi:hypothetical protein LCGC14_2365710 [marine sediment metagenome]|uniref:TIR domain-containing protein n=1 Tax=marine sediment metagenome TaxID=412755 RepID=A0A0F9CSJ6_9ZZZZ
MANREHLALLKKGVKVWNQWRRDHPEIQPDLTRADLRNADLSWANLERANLESALLLEALLSNAALTWSNLKGAGLRKADLSGVMLPWANLLGATLAGANLSNVKLFETVLVDVDLSGALNLASCKHIGPSFLDHRTLQRSGALPLEFLRGCGLPDALIDYSLLGKVIRYDSCFICYSGKDNDFAERLHAELQASGIRCWFAPHDMRGGRKTLEQIDQAISLHDRSLLILSEHSMNSEWVKTETAKARKREVTEGKRVLFPVRLVDFDTIRDWECFDSDTGEDLAKEIRKYFIPDFSEWKDPHVYQKAFRRLLRDLRTGG